MEETEESHTSQMISSCGTLLPKSRRYSIRKCFLLCILLMTCTWLFYGEDLRKFITGKGSLSGDSETNNVARHLQLRDQEPPDTAIPSDISNKEGDDSSGILTWQKPFMSKYKPINKLSSSNFHSKIGKESSIGRPDLKTVEKQKKMDMMKERMQASGLQEVPQETPVKEEVHQEDTREMRKKKLVDELKQRLKLNLEKKKQSAQTLKSTEEVVSPALKSLTQKDDDAKSEQEKELKALERENRLKSLKEERKELLVSKIKQLKLDRLAQVQAPGVSGDVTKTDPSGTSKDSIDRKQNTGLWDKTMVDPLQRNGVQKEITPLKPKLIRPKSSSMHDRELLIGAPGKPGDAEQLSMSYIKTISSQTKTNSLADMPTPTYSKNQNLDVSKLSNTKTTKDAIKVSSVNSNKGLKVPSFKNKDRAEVLLKNYRERQNMKLSNNPLGAKVGDISLHAPAVQSLKNPNVKGSEGVNRQPVKTLESKINQPMSNFQAANGINSNGGFIKSGIFLKTQKEKAKISIPERGVTGSDEVKLSPLRSNIKTQNNLPLPAGQNAQRSFGQPSRASGLSDNKDRFNFDTILENKYNELKKKLNEEGLNNSLRYRLLEKLKLLELRRNKIKSIKSIAENPDKQSKPQHRRSMILNQLRKKYSSTPTKVEVKNERRLPTLYELYSFGHIESGLTAESKEFLLNGKGIRILSGTIQYFRVHPAYWRDSLRKLRAAGFNTVTTEVPWNFHQPYKSTVDFTSPWRDLRKFLALAKEEDLFVILRVGPYISAEWDFGGLPHWLLQEEDIKLRTPQPKFFTPASTYLTVLSKLLVDFQFSRQNGAQPLIMVQLESDFLIMSVMADRDKRYLMSLKNTMVDAGLSDVLYVVTNPPNQIAQERLVPGVFQAVSFRGDPTFPFFMLSHTQPDAPKLTMNFYTGNFDRFTEKKHHTEDPKEFHTNLEWMLSNGSSVNLYMFHGGTTFGFMNGGSRLQRESYYRPGVSSYDYDAPLTESGDYTKKYWSAKELAKKYYKGPEIWMPEPPPERIKKAYPMLQVQEYLTFDDIMSMIPESMPQFNPKTMEAMDFHDGSGQRQGFTLYRKDSVVISPYSLLKINGIIRDILYILVDGKLTNAAATAAAEFGSDGYWIRRNPSFEISGDNHEHRLELLVESMGRDSMEMTNGKKGIRGTVTLDEMPLNHWEAFPLEFPSQWIRQIPRWRPYNLGVSITSPGLYRANLRVAEDLPRDTFLNPFGKKNKWTKGQIFVNGFNLGRYWDVGPTKTSYIPAPLLQTGDNEILMFELFKPGDYISFQDTPEL